MTELNSQGRTATGRALFKEASKKPGPRAQDRSPEVRLSTHGRYQIKSGRLAGEFVARAFPTPPGKARGMIAEARGKSEDDAIAALHDIIDAREARRTEIRRVDTSTGHSVPSVEEYAEAIGQIALSRPQSAMLTALSLAEDGLSESRMAHVAGYKSRASANRAFAAAGVLIATYLSVELASSDAESDVDGTVLLGYRGSPENDDDAGNWILHAELRDAVRSMM